MKIKRIPFGTFIDVPFMEPEEVPKNFKTAYETILSAINNASLHPDIESLQVGLGRGPISVIMNVKMDGITREPDE